MSRVCFLHALAFLFFWAGIKTAAKAEEVIPFSSRTGITGLNIIPTARMDQAGTLRLGTAYAEPYHHIFAGFQIAAPLSVTMRQSLYAPSFGKTPQTVYPGLDFKLRLRQEGRYAPAIAFGMNGALGHRRFSSEYLALSKRFYDLDLTAGIAWGRLGGRGHIKNPLANIAKHFEKERDYGSEDAAKPSDWFTGKEAGFFAGAEYRTPIKGLSLALDYNAESYKIEKDYYGFKSPSPWSAGLNYTPVKPLSLGVAATADGKIMARVTVQGDISSWKAKPYKEVASLALSPLPQKRTSPDDARKSAQKEKIRLGVIRINGHETSTALHLNPYQPTAMQIGRAARHLAAQAGEEIKTVTISPLSMGLRGKAVTFSRRDLVQAMALHRGSPEELWNNIEFGENDISLAQARRVHRYALIPELHLSLGEEETTHLYRSSLILQEKTEWPRGFYGETSIRINLHDNLHRLKKFRSLNLKSARADRAEFAENRISIDRAYSGWRGTIAKDTHLSVTAGYAEEMYGAVGGEILYRPFHSPLAVGAEGWHVQKRDPQSFLVWNLARHSALTGHINFFYDVPDTDITAYAKIGKFIGGDTGFSAGALMTLNSGIKAAAYITGSNAGDRDIFDSKRTISSGFTISVPFGGLRFAPQGSQARIRLAPIGRNDGAILDNPVPLYEITEPVSYRRLGRSWQAVLN